MPLKLESGPRSLNELMNWYILADEQHTTGYIQSFILVTVSWNVTENICKSDSEVS